MAVDTVLINVVDKSVPPLNPKRIAVIGMPNPATNVYVNREQLLQLIQFPQYWVTDAVTGDVISGANITDYFPEEGGGVDPEEVQDIVRQMTDTETSLTSMNPIANSTITNYVNQSIESSTAEFKGTYETKAEMDAVTADNNDYAFLIIYNYTLLTEEPASFDPTEYYKLVDGEYVPGESGNAWAADTWYEQDDTVNHYERYKWVDPAVSGSHWAYEYDVSNTSFTTEEWDAIDSGITAEKVAVIDNLKPVATSGDYDDLTNKPTLGTVASHDVEEFATAEQGTKADNAIPGLSSGTTENNLVAFGANGKTVKDSGIGSGPNYVVVNGVRQYTSLTEPTGDIPVGSIGFGF
jgi:hypothetical protein